ncbi:MAG: RNA polymerase sigma factor [Parcubacteria group bacterium]|nr:RNA polymerase sigma factor [Parcubacteria group bacterium]
MNPEAQFLKAFDEYADALFKHCFFRVSDREGAKDLVQETFARAWDHLRQGKEVRDYRAFLYRIADNLVVDFYRKKKAVSLEELGDKEKNTLFYDERGAREVEDDARRVLSEIQKLPEDYQKVVTMRYVDGLSPKEIAVIFGESENVISVRIHRGVEKLRALFLRKNKKMLKLEDILKNLRANISFSKNEKKEMRERLEEYAKFHPVRMEESARLLGQKSPFYDFSLLLFLRKRTMPIILILALMFGGGGVSYAAEGAVPGDALYQIKVKVNEEVRDLVALTPEAKADWESRLVERRLEEAEKLAAGDALDPAKQAVIEEKIAEHIEKVESRLAKVEEKKDIARASEISSNLETVLRAHGEVFVKIKEKQAQKLAVAAAPESGENCRKERSAS